MFIDQTKIIKRTFSQTITIILPSSLPLYSLAFLPIGTTSK